jgi:hypothetical protein
MGAQRGTARGRAAQCGAGARVEAYVDLACALYGTPRPEMVSFLTLDTDQRRAAELLGFRV